MDGLYGNDNAAGRTSAGVMVTMGKRSHRKNLAIYHYFSEQRATRSKVPPPQAR